jgi:hypothetical protein
METIKISVEVSVNLSENTQNFIKSLFGNAIAPLAPATPAKPAKPAPAKPTPQPAAPAQTQSAAKPAPSAPAASKNIEEVRGMLAEKVNEHRDKIKQKLNELGAPSVTKLDPAKYDEMYNFLESL